MAATGYDMGDVARLAGTFTGTAGLVDPETVTARVRNGLGTMIGTFAYGTGATQLIRTATGAYRLDVILNTAGQWAYRFDGAGANQAAEEFTLHVRTSLIDGDGS